MQDVIDCVDSGKQPSCNGLDGLAALDIAYALRESVQRGNSRVELPLGNCERDKQDVRDKRDVKF
jgi:hypothetical protein